MSILTSVVDKSRLYIGIGNEDSLPNRMGTSIKCYDKASIFTQLFGKSITINVGSKQYCVNKKSLTKHLNSLGLNEAQNEINLLGYENIINKYKVIPSNEKLSNSLSLNKRTHLFRTMIGELHLNNTEEVKKLVREGAYFDKEYFRALGTQFLSDTETNYALYSNYWTSYTFYKYTPMAKAVELGNQTLANFFKNIKQDISSDKKVEYDFYNKGFQLSVYGSSHIKTEYVMRNEDGSFYLK